MISGPMVDSIILSMAEPRSEEVEAVESDTIMAPSGAALEWTSTWADSDTRTDCVTVETLETLVDWATEEESGRWTDDARTSVLELVSGMNTWVERKGHERHREDSSKQIRQTDRYQCISIM